MTSGRATGRAGHFCQGPAERGNAVRSARSGAGQSAYSPCYFSAPLPSAHPCGGGRPTWSAEAGVGSRTKVDAARRHRFAVRIVEADPDVRAAADDIRGKRGGH